MYKYHERISAMSMPKNKKYKYVVSFIVALCFHLSFVLCFAQDGHPTIRFLGAARMVGGSCCLIDTGKTRALIDFGLFYGEYRALNDNIDFDPSTIDFVFLTHAHIDHAGRVPLLYRYGFKGKTIGTDATKDLSRIVLEMSLKLAKERASYTVDDIVKMMDNFMTIPYNRTLNLNNELSVRFRDAGHIMGSSIIELWIRKENRKIKIVATGDLGNDHLSLLKQTDIIRDGDYIVIESTTGPIQRKSSSLETFGKEIRKTLKMGGSVLIPAFVVDRTQKLLYVLGDMKRKGLIPQEVPIYLDSPTARAVTKLYRTYSRYFGPNALSYQSCCGSPLSFPSVHEISSHDALMTHDRGQPAIYISSSAMLDHANAPRHLERMIENPMNLLALVTWQAPGSPGWKIQNGAKTIQIPIEEYGETGSVRYVEKQVNIRVKTFDMFSCHADGCQILTWLSNFLKTKEIFVVHGEKDNAIRMAEIITQKLGLKATAPEMGAVAYLFAQGKDYSIKTLHHHDLCSGMETSNTTDNSMD